MEEEEEEKKEDIVGIGCNYFHGSPRIKERKIEDIKSKEMCADACVSEDNCPLWRYNKKNKHCIINFVKAKPNKHSVFGYPTLTPPEVFYGTPEIEPEVMKDITSEKKCFNACQHIANCMIWKFNYKKEKCTIYFVKLANPEPYRVFGFPPPITPTLLSSTLTCCDQAGEEVCKSIGQSNNTACTNAVQNNCPGNDNYTDCVDVMTSNVCNQFPNEEKKCIEQTRSHCNLCESL